ncbi:MAG: 50S ribosomal protein L18 [Actinomycetota bacterium]
MMQAAAKRRARVRRHRRVRKGIYGEAARPRLAVYRSNRHIYVQLVDDGRGHTVASASDLDPEVRGTSGHKKGRAKEVGKLIARRAKESGVERAVFDRGGFQFHGRVAAVAEGAREEGLQI